MNENEGKNSIQQRDKAGQEGMERVGDGEDGKVRDKGDRIIEGKRGRE
jgi:hypothetical protein